MGRPVFGVLVPKAQQKLDTARDENRELIRQLGELRSSR